MTMHLPPHMPHPREELFHDLVDGRLDADDRVSLERHLAACDACTARIARLRALLAATSALPRELAPERDAWPVLRATLAERATTPVRSGRARWIRTSLAAAAVLLVTVAGWSALRRIPPTAMTPEAPLAAAPTYLDVERDYAHAAAELTAQLEATRGRLSPAAIATVERSLATIDAALAESRAALAADPSNSEVARFVAASYERKLAVLRRSAELSSGD